MREWLLPFLFAFATGVLSSWGVGGGTLLLVCMSLFLGVEHRVAQTINLLFFLPTAAVSLLFHGQKGLLDKTAWRQAAIPGTLAALAGAVMALMVDVSVLRKPFGVFLLWSGASMLRQAKKGKEDERGGR